MRPPCRGEDGQTPTAASSFTWRCGLRCLHAGVSRSLKAHDSLDAQRSHHITNIIMQHITQSLVSPSPTSQTPPSLERTMTAQKRGEVHSPHTLSVLDAWWHHFTPTDDDDEFTGYYDDYGRQ